MSMNQLAQIAIINCINNKLDLTWLKHVDNLSYDIVTFVVDHIINDTTVTFPKTFSWCRWGLGYKKALINFCNTINANTLNYNNLVFDFVECSVDDGYYIRVNILNSAQGA